MLQLWSSSNWQHDDSLNKTENGPGIIHDPLIFAEKIKSVSLQFIIMLYICISLITSGVKYFFIPTCCPFASSLGKSLFNWSANMFSYCVGGLLTLWILSFAVHNFSVMCSPLSNCAFVACPYGVISMKSSLNLMSWGFSLLFLLRVL